MVKLPCFRWSGSAPSVSVYDLYLLFTNLEREARSCRLDAPLPMKGDYEMVRWDVLFGKVYGVRCFIGGSYFGVEFGIKEGEESTVLVFGQHRGTKAPCFETQ